MISSTRRHRARPRQLAKCIPRNEVEDYHPRTTRTHPTPPGFRHFTVASAVFLLAFLWLPQFGSATQVQRPRRIQSQNQSEHESIQPTACVETGSELLQAVRGYYGGGVSNAYDSTAAQTYGWPIDGWCLSSEVAEKLADESESPLKGHLSAALQNIAIVHDDDSVSNLDALELTQEWIFTFSGTSCSDVCSAANGEEVEEDKETLNGEDTLNSNENATESVNNKGNTPSNTNPGGSRNKTTTGMLIRLIPVKLVAILSLMCLVLGIRQVFLSADRDNCYCCGCKLGCSFFGFGSQHSYEGIDPSDVSTHQKVVEFELLQLAESGDMDAEIDVVIA